ncbi:MAG: hypothetical protein AAGC60_20220 [Acidobacteriota bacterium]
MHASRILFALFVFSLVATPSFAVEAEAEPAVALPATATYACYVDIANGFDDCFNPVTVAPYSSSSNQRVVTADLDNGFRWRSMTVRYEICNSSGWTWNVGDSPTNNGFGGDAASTQHDAEAQALNGTLSVYKSDIGGGGLTCQFAGPPNPVGCITQEFLVRNDYFEFDSNTASSFPRDVCGGPALFDFPAYDEADSEDPTGLYEDKIYVGLNRTVGSSGRSGSGIQRACVVLSTASTPSPATVTSECGF